MRKFYALFLLILFGVSLGYSQDKASYSTTQDGNWFDGTTWVGGVMPSATGGHTISVDHNVTVSGSNWRGRNGGSITIAAGKTLTHVSGTWGIRDGAVL